ncbi:MAG: GTPase ObgE, partial [Planctomycetota bacterium]
QFLRHVERTRLLVHLLDAAPLDGSEPLDNYRTIRRELEAHSPALAETNELIALSKTDLLAPADAAALAKRLADTLGRPVHPISSAARRGLDDLLDACWKSLGRRSDQRLAWSSADTDADTPDPA